MVARRLGSPLTPGSLDFVQLLFILLELAFTADDPVLACMEVGAGGILALKHPRGTPENLAMEIMR